MTKVNLIWWYYTNVACSHMTYCTVPWGLYMHMYMADDRISVLNNVLSYSLLVSIDNCAGFCFISVLFSIQLPLSSFIPLCQRFTFELH